ncbi:hypothetical protein HYX15_04210 [Candidatus Woesearchaeota archaeon]|nr:hypothetical protein [Candidatus Woesearchaeota archaeon]
MATQTQNYKIRRTEIDIPHNNSIITFVYDKRCQGAYSHATDFILRNKLKLPTMAETSSLVLQAFLSYEPEFIDIVNIMKNTYIWAFTGILYAPKGVYFEDNPKMKDEMPYMKEDDIIKKLEKNDPSVRFVPYGYNTEYMSPSELERNPFILGLAGGEGAAKLAEISTLGEIYKDLPWLFAFRRVHSHIINFSALGSGRWLGDRLGIGSVDSGGSGSAFGIINNTENISKY